MLLAIDIGNSNVTLGWFRDGTLVQRGRAVTAPGATSRELELLLDEALGRDGLSLDAVGAMSLASVVPSLTGALQDVAARRSCSILVASASTIPIGIRVDQPESVGADRLVNALAAARLHGAPAVVADLGTATTVDAVAADGAFVGGAIAPGLDLGLEALASRTAQLPRIDLVVPERAIGRTTVSAMQSGTVFGYQALVVGLISRIRAELAADSGVPANAVHAILTGGLSAVSWASVLEGVEVIDPDLTLKGLAILHAEVVGPAAGGDVRR
ncbi:MAG: type III pantothenate kinase [Chloroflexota bacterium]|nr:MAG: type III pantothenate kinase [Chloroflexota bacterium]